MGEGKLMNNEHDMATMIVGLLSDLRKSLDKLTEEVAHLRSDMNINKGDYSRMGARLEHLEKWRVVSEAELLKLSPVSSVLEQMKKWLIIGFAIFFMFGIFAVGGLFIWSKLPAGTILTPVQPTAPDPSSSSPHPKNPKQRTMFYSWSDSSATSAPISSRWSILPASQSLRSVSNE